MDTVPFKVHDPDATVTETEGVMTLYEDRLTLQLETRDVILGKFKRTNEVNVHSKISPLPSFAAAGTAPL